MFMLFGHVTLFQEFIYYKSNLEEFHLYIDSAGDMKINCGFLKLFNASSSGEMEQIIFIHFFIIPEKKTLEFAKTCFCCYCP